MKLWELTARERIRDSLARYSWSGDSLRLDELALAFCVDGELQLRDSDPICGRDAIVEFLRGVGPPSSEPRDTTPGARRIVRHNLSNVRFLELGLERAVVASYFTVVTEIGLDHYGRYRDTFEPVGEEWLIRHRFVSTDWQAENSTMARP